jgi:hypothetical protein
MVIRLRLGPIPGEKLLGMGKIKDTILAGGDGIDDVKPLKRRLAAPPEHGP